MATPDTYKIKVTLRHIKPPIWRRLRVSSDMPLELVHLALQIVMGWTDGHLHQFTVGKRRYAILDPDDNDETLIDELDIPLSDLLKRVGDKAVYEYDFGDGWEHTLELEEVSAGDIDGDIPKCLAGRRAGPPEDVGGVGGYANFLRAIGDPDDENHEMYLDWVDGSFDPEAFDVDTINEELSSEFPGRA